MSDSEVTVVRLNLRERDPRLRAALAYLHDESEVRGLTMFRGVMGYGADHQEHSSSLFDLSLGLPVVVEFFVPETLRAASSRGARHQWADALGWRCVALSVRRSCARPPRGCS